ncbi:hypothetical protein D8I24_7346 [Cupriavidus necator H850]|uniref:hypothetical protein n=1 Tax=Cupriavidus necator TaxID=106590 RepID=UPI00129DABEB|nr:hypothetical protein [Cupriavidus necator]KAI3596422.1 hypothetical protein D8I24_7346 [Cupriavidus necator H850]
MEKSTFGWGAIESPADAPKDVQKAFEFATRSARNELKREQERADSEFHKALRNTAPIDLQAITSAQAKFARALAIASENYHQALANAERVRLCATSITEARIESWVLPATLDPLSEVVRRVALQHAMAFTS